MGRREELLDIFKDVDSTVRTIVEPMIDNLVFIEGQLVELRELPFVKVNPKDKTMQKTTPTYRIYKELLSQQKDIVRILCSQIHKTGSEDGESPLREYMRSLGMQK